MEIKYSTPDVYPITKTFIIDGETITSAVGDDAATRIKDFFAANGTTTPPAFIADLKMVLTEHAILSATMRSISHGSFASTDKDPVYVGDVVSESSRVFTPQEAAVNALDMINDVNNPLTTFIAAN